MSATSAFVTSSFIFNEVPFSGSGRIVTPLKRGVRNLGTYFALPPAGAGDGAATAALAVDDAVVETGAAADPGAGIADSAVFAVEVAVVSLAVTAASLAAFWTSVSELAQPPQTHASTAMANTFWIRSIVRFLMCIMI